MATRKAQNITISAVNSEGKVVEYGIFTPLQAKTLEQVTKVLPKGYRLINVEEAVDFWSMVPKLIRQEVREEVRRKLYLARRN